MLLYFLDFSCMLAMKLDWEAEFQGYTRNGVVWDYAADIV
jgi:hypothetical protein